MAKRQLWQNFWDWFQPVRKTEPDPEFSAESGAQTVALGAASTSYGILQPKSQNTRHDTRHIKGSAIGFDESMEEIDEAELLDFVSADREPDMADPLFREHLREELWNLVRSGAATLPKDH